MLDLDAKIQNTEAIERQKITNKDTYDFVESKKNENTKRKTQSDVRQFREWLAVEGEPSNFEETEPAALDMCLARYFLSVKNAKTKKDLEPGTIKGIQASIKDILVTTIMMLTLCRITDTNIPGMFCEPRP